MRRVEEPDVTAVLAHVTGLLAHVAHVLAHQPPVQPNLRDVLAAGAQ
jgi:hypothetical protein